MPSKKRKQRTDVTYYCMKHAAVMCMFALTKLKYYELDQNLRTLATIYGVLSVAYYNQDRSLVNDEHFDILCKHLHRNVDELESIGVSEAYRDKEALAAGSGYQFTIESKVNGYAQNAFGIYQLVVEMI